MERTGFQRELRDREVDVECRGFGPSFNMDNTHYHDCFEAVSYTHLTLPTTSRV